MPMAQVQPEYEPTPRRRRQAERVGLRELAVAALHGLAGTAMAVVLVIALVAGAMLAAFGRAAPLVTVPKVIGQPVNAAEKRLASAHLKMIVANYDYNTSVKEGSIISLSPYEGKQVRAGREVRATVSRGSRTVKAPDLVGLSLSEATAKLTELDLQVGTAPKQANEKSDGTILRQDPAAETVLSRKAKVNLAVSGGPDFGSVELADGTRFLFRTLTVTVPQGKALQMVSVYVEKGDEEKSFLDRLCRPGETVKADFYGPEGARVRAKIEDDTIFSQRL
jgi:eukaryotic-like serine/threonine-protein kinase